MAVVEAPFPGQPYQAFSMHWNSPDASRYVVEFFKGPTYNSIDIDALRVRAWNIHQQGLGYDPMRTMRELVSNMQAGRGGSIYFARTEGPEAQDIGYVTQRLMEIKTNEGDLFGASTLPEDDDTIRALVISTKVFLPGHQQKGLGTFFAEQANLMHNPDIFVGRTQNPYIILALRRTGLFETIYPIDGLYGQSCEELKWRQKILKAIVERVKYPAVDLRNGFCSGVYPQGEKRAFVLDQNNKEAVEIYRIMTEEIGMDPAKGDAIVYTAAKRGSVRYPDEEPTA